MRPSDYKTIEQANHYELFRFSGGLKYIFVDEEKLLLEWLDKYLAKDNLISADIGTGTGRGLDILKKVKKIKKIYAIDRSDPMLKFVRSKFNKDIKQSKISALKGSSNDFKIAPNSMDLAISLHVFKHIPKPQSSIAHIAKALKKDGYLIFDILNQQSLVNINLDSCIANDLHQIKKILNQSGLDIVDIKSVHYLGETIYNLLPPPFVQIFNLIDQGLTKLSLPFATKLFILAQKK